MLPLFTEEEVSKHDSTNSAYVIYQSYVYDVTKFAEDHPGGSDFILQHAGTDISDVLDSEIHRHSKNAYNILAGLKIGRTHGTGEDEPEDSVFLDVNKPLLRQMLNSNFSKEFYLKQVHIPRHIDHDAILFDNKYIELLTKTPWYVVPLFWTPISLFFLHNALQVFDVFFVSYCFFLGIGMWTLLEYCFHRFLFHIDTFLPSHRYFLTLHFLLHGVHHFAPMDQYRLVMPPTMLLALSAPVISIAVPLMGFDQFSAFAGGIYTGYQAYDLLHYYFHHGTPKVAHLKEMKTYHALHHYQNENMGFGVSTKVWDRVFGTLQSIKESKD